jgi:molybdopterin-guanine dinucleotide biosynthesis protein A
MTTSEPGYDAVVLAGGGARRLDGADKPGLVVGGRSLVAWVGAAVAGAGRLVLVGPHRPELPDAVVVREDPPGGGPVPALRAGLGGVRAPQVAVLAADLPFLRAADVDALRRSAAGRPGAVLVDADERPQWLAGVWRTADLRAALAAYRGASLRGLMEPLGPVHVRAAGERPAWYDCDTRSDVEAASRMLRENSA